MGSDSGEVTQRLTSLWHGISAHPRIASLVLGAVSATGYPPLRLWPIALAALVVFLALLQRTEGRRQAALLGWLFGWSHLTLANNWIATAFTHQAEMPAFLGWIAVPLLCVYLAIYPGLAALGARMIARGANPLRFGLTFAGCWIVTEWLRSWVFTGYPWPPLGLIALGSFSRPGLAMVLPWIGTYALSGLVLVFAAAILTFVMRRNWLGSGLVAAVFTAFMLAPAPRQTEGDLPFTLVQPDLRQEEINDPTKFEAQFANIASLTMEEPAKAGNRRLVLWPESAIPDYLRDGYPQRYYRQMTANADPEYARSRIGKVIGPGAMLLTGNVDLEIEDGRAVGAYNAVSAIDSDGDIRASYNKAHLVPYGEYLALRWLLEPLGATRLVAGTIDFIPGPGPQTIDLGAWGRAGVQICYEIVFSGQVVDRENRPDYIFNPSNDGWFGTWGPPQHIAQARMRAIEEGLPVLRATTTGISGVIDANGVVRQHIGMGVAARIDGLVPPPKSPTLFARLGNILPLGWAVLLLVLSSVAMRRRRV